MRPRSIIAGVAVAAMAMAGPVVLEVSDDDGRRARAKAQKEAAAERQRAAMINREIKAAKLRKIAARGGIIAVDPPCPGCEGYGYVQVHSPRAPAFETCDLCGNPEGHPLP